MALALAVVTGLMACVAFVRVTSAERPLLANAVGADVSEIMVTDAAGHETSLASGEWTVAYVFNSNCGHCVAAAPGGPRRIRTCRSWL